MQRALKQCDRHAQILDMALTALANLDATGQNAEIDTEQTRILDQLAYRFGKLQDTMGEKVLPLILEIAQEVVIEHATFIEKLNQLEKMGAISSVEDWKKFRVARNSLAHEYHEQDDLKKAALEVFIVEARKLVGFYNRVKEYIAKHFPQ